MRRTIWSREAVRTAMLTAAWLLPFSSFPSAQAQTVPAPAVAPKVVSLDLAARDKKGNPLSDLGPADVEITSGGAPVQLKDLRLVNQAPTPDHSFPVTLIFDQLEPGNAKMARQVATELLNAAPASGISFAVLKIDGRLHLLQEYSSDREALTKAVGAATGAANIDYSQLNDAAEKRMAPGGHRRAMAETLLAILLDSQQMARDPHTTPSVAGLMAVARGLEEVPGRKTVVYFCQGLPYDLSDPELLGSIALAAIRSSVSLYAVDAHIVDPGSGAALMAASAMSKTAAMSGAASDPSKVGGPTGPGSISPYGMLGVAGAEQIGRVSSGSSDEGGPPLQWICRETGGLRMLNSGDVKKNMRRIVTDTMTYYTAFFAPPVESKDGRFRTIRLKALRSGIVLDARGPYMSLSAGAVPVVSRLEARLLEALAAPKLPEDIAFRSALLRFGKTPKGSDDAVVIEAPVGPHVSVLAQVKDKSGAVVQKFSDDISGEGAANTQERTITFRRHFGVAPGEYQLETVVMDADGGKIGAQRQSVAIPPEGDGPALGDIVLVRRIEPFAGDSDRSNPLRCAEGKIVPNLSGRISREGNPSVTLFFDIHPDAHATEEPTLKAEVRRDGNLIGTVPLNLAPNPERNMVPYLARLGTQSLRPGAYEMKVMLSQGAQTAEQKVSFTLE